MTHPSLRHLVATLILACAVGAVLQGSLEAQPRSLLLYPAPEGHLVAVAAIFPSGNAADPEGSEGTAFLLGSILEGELNRRLIPMSARVQVEVERNRTTLLFLAPPRSWEDGWREVRTYLASGPLAEALVERERNALLNRLRFDEGAPIRVFQREKAILLFGAGDPSARPLRGTRASVERLDSPALTTARDRTLRMSDARVAVTGPVTMGEVARVVGGAVTLAHSPAPAPFRTPPPPVTPPPTDTTVSPPADTTAANPLPPPPVIRTGALNLPAWRAPTGIPSSPWNEEERIMRDEQLTSTWIGAAYPIPRGTPPVLAEFVAHLVTEALNPIPPEPGQYGSEARVEDVRGESVLLVTATVDPRLALRWEERIMATMELLAESPPEGAFFDLARRRFRTARLLAVAPPEALARWVALRAADDGAVPDLDGEIWGLDQEGVRSLARNLGAARVLLYGPESMLGR